MKAIFYPVIIFIFSVCVSAQTKESYKVDEFVLYNCEIGMSLLYDYAITLQIDPQLKAHIIYYDGKIYRGKMVLPRRGEAKARVNDLRRYLVEDRRIEPARITVINGGIRKEHSVEFWIVPEAALPPKPTPTLKTIKYAKGRPARLCSELF